MRVSFAPIALILAFIACPSFGDGSKLTGVWEAGDRAHQAIYGFLRISPSHVYFSRNGQNWECKTNYEVLSTGTGNTYPDELENFRNIVKTRTWEHVKIRLGKSECTQSLFFLFAFPSDIDNYADFVDYDNESRTTGWGHFHKLQDLESNDLTIYQAAPTSKRDVWLRSCGADADAHQYRGSERKSFMEKCLGTDLRGSQKQWTQCLDAKRESGGFAYADYLRKCLSR